MRADGGLPALGGAASKVWLSEATWCDEVCVWAERGERGARGAVNAQALEVEGWSLDGAQQGVRGPTTQRPHQASRAQATTIATYKQAAQRFTEWALANHLAPRKAAQWDDLLVEFKNVHSLTRSQFGNLVAAVEFFFPRFGHGKG